MVKARARPVAPGEWQQLLRHAQVRHGSAEPHQQQPILLDVRNGYEWDAGHFQGAVRPLEVTAGAAVQMCSAGSCITTMTHSCGPS